MRIRTQLLIAMALFAILITLISALVFTTNQEVERLTSQGELAENIAIETGELGYLSNDYILYRESQQAERWQAKYDSIAGQVARLSVSGAEELAIAGNLAANLKNTETVFDAIVSAPVPAGGATPASIQLSWSRMAVQNQGMIFDAGRLARLLRDEADGLEQTRNLLILTLMGTFVAFLLTSYFFFYRRTVRSIDDLQAGAAIIGSGNLTHVIDESADDEIGDLARAFNRMTRSLHTVIASKADLEREVEERKQAERALRESREKYRALIETTSDFIWEMDAHGRYTYCSPQMEMLWGLRPQDMVGKTLFDVMPEESRAGVFAYFTEMGQNPRPFSGLETVSYDGSGRLVSIEISGVPFFDDHGSLIGYRGITRDITERKKAGEALRENEARLKALYSSMAEGLAEHRVLYEEGKAVDYLITDVNPAFEKITGLPGNSVIGRRASEVYGTGSPPYLDIYDRVASSATPEHFETYFAPMGKHFAVSVFSPEQGRFATVFSDISERKQAEEKIRLAAERVEIAQRAAHAGFWDWDIPSGKLTWTDELYRLFGLSPEDEASFATWLEIMHPDDREQAMTRINRAIEERKFLMNEFRIRLPDGSDRSIGAWGNTEYDAEGKALRMSGICMDTTDIKRAEQQIAHLASFPEMNPNPVLEMDMSGEVLYSNAAVARALGQVEHGDPGIFLPKDFREILPQVLEGDVQEEVRVGERVFLETITYVPQTRTLRIYAKDITEREKAEEALRESELRYRTVANNTYDWEFWLDPDGKFLYCSPSCDRITGHQAGEFLEDPGLLGRLIHPDDQATFEQHFQEQKEKKTTGRGEWRILHPNGTWRWIEHVCQPVFGEEGEFIGTRGSNRDVTGRREAEAALRESEERFRTIAETSPVQISVSRVSDSTILYVNTAYEQAFGFAAGELIGKRAPDLYCNPEDRRALIDTLRKEGIVRNREVRVKRKDGTPFWVVTSVAPLRFGGEDALLGVSIDSTDRKRVEQALHETSQYLENLINHANAPIIVWDPEFRITRFNRASERLTGLSADRAIGRDLTILFPSATMGQSKDRIRRAMAGERWEAVEIPVLHMSGEVRTVLWNSATLYGPDGTTVISTIAQGQDITDRKRVEQTLHETSQYLENLINYANAPIIVWDPEFRITRFNHAFERLTGRTAEEVVGRDLGILFPAESLERSMDHIRKTMAGERWEVVEIPIQHRSGEVRTVLWNSATLYGQDGKTVSSAIAQGQDITERKRMEDEVALKAAEIDAANVALREEIAGRIHAGESLERTMALLKATFESTADGILSIDSDGVVAGFNQNFVTMWGVPFALIQTPDQGSLLKHMAGQLVDPERFLATIAELEANPGRESYDMVVLEDGRIFERDSRPQRIGHDIVGRVWSFRDITERKRAEERVLASLNEKEVLLREIHHRVKNNLQLISGLLDLTRLRTQDPETMGILTDMMLKIQTMAQIHTRLYESKQFDRVNMGAQIQDQITSLLQIYGQKEREILCETELEDLYLPIDQAIPCALAVNEILSNAFKHAFRGRMHGFLRVTSSRHDSRVRITVQDDGRGIPPDLDIARSRSLGLKLIRNLVEKQLRGSLAIQRKEGTEVIVEFPILTQEGEHVTDTRSGR